VDLQVVRKTSVWLADGTTLLDLVDENDRPCSGQYRSHRLGYGSGFPRQWGYSTRGGS